MKQGNIYALLSLFIAFFYNCVPPSDEEGPKTTEEDNTTAELPWQGETEKFTISVKDGVHLDDPNKDAGTAYITFPSSSVTSTRWEFAVNLSFNPSANNYARFYLTSTSTDLSGELNGYFIQIGGVKDNVALYQQNGTDLKLLASGRELMKGNNAPKLNIKVECDSNGYWTFWTRLTTEEEYIKEQQIKQNSIDESICSGIYCVYTKTRCHGFTFHHIKLSNDVETTTDPEEDPDNTEPEKPIQAHYPQEVKNILLLNEVMYDNATDGAEYIEIYNPADTVIAVPSLKILRYIANTSGGTTTTTTAVLEQMDSNTPITVGPHSYLCLTKSPSIIIKKHQVDGESIIETPKFPRIANEGGYLAIMTNEENPRLIDKCCYFESMHSSGKKRNQGVALEKKSPELNSALQSNWTSSKDKTGGTPGRKNSLE